MCKNYGRKRKNVIKKKMKIIEKKNGKIYGVLFIYWKFVNFKNRYVFV